MATTRSADGTTMAYHTTGGGPAVVIVNGAMSTAADAEPIAAALAEAGLLGVTYDRRARVGSGDTQPYAPEREAEDLAAVIEAAGSGAAVLGHSSGAVVALYAASLGVPVGRLFLSEPPFNFGDDAPRGFEQRLQAMIDTVTRTRRSPRSSARPSGCPSRWCSRSATHRSSAPWWRWPNRWFDAILTRAVSTPTAAMTGLTVPVTILCGVETFPDLQDRLATTGRADAPGGVHPGAGVDRASPRSSRHHPDRRRPDAPATDAVAALEAIDERPGAVEPASDPALHCSAMERELVLVAGPSGSGKSRLTAGVRAAAGTTGRLRPRRRSCRPAADPGHPRLG